MPARDPVDRKVTLVTTITEEQVSPNCHRLRQLSHWVGRHHHLDSRRARRSSMVPDLNRREQQDEDQSGDDDSAWHDIEQHSASQGAEN